jgi:hypothetical protein
VTVVDDEFAVVRDDIDAVRLELRRVLDLQHRHIGPATEDFAQLLG